jgi:hypothetical protein
MCDSGEEATMAANLEPSTDVRPTGSKLDLIQATVAAISQHGLSELTSAKIAGRRAHRRVDQLPLRQQGSAAPRDAARGVGGVRAAQWHR